MARHRAPRLADLLAALEHDEHAVTGAICEAYGAGDVRRARRGLLAHHRKEPFPPRKERIGLALRDLRLWVEPAEDPAATSMSGIGSGWFGRHQPRPDGSSIATLWATVLGLPFYPLGAYLVSRAGRSVTVHGRVPLPSRARLARSAAWVIGSVALLSLVPGVLRQLGVVAR
ncbi:MAG: hypothetical protein KDA24_00195 [Deltaproteobacteria bacterium]|nr:hypothetical protein [Deltaproteobacteria bacterium]